MTASSNYAFPNGFDHWLDTYTLLAMRYAMHSTMLNNEVVDTFDGIPTGLLAFIRSNPMTDQIQELLQSATDVFEASYPQVVFATQDMMIYDPEEWFEEIMSSPDFYSHWVQNRRFPLPSGTLFVAKYEGVHSSKSHAIVARLGGQRKAVAYFDNRNNATECLMHLKYHRAQHVTNLQIYSGYGKTKR